jgi:hypothetical protein
MAVSPSQIFIIGLLALHYLSGVLQRMVATRGYFVALHLGYHLLGALGLAQLDLLVVVAGMGVGRAVLLSIVAPLRHGEVRVASVAILGEVHLFLLEFEHRELVGIIPVMLRGGSSQVLKTGDPQVY